MRSTFVGLGGWLKNSFIDFPGTVSAVLFFSGCNLRCPYCHNPQLVEGHDDISGQSNEIWSFLEKRQGLIDGVVFSGGEPTIHSGVPGLCREVKEMGYRIKLDSNGLLPEKIAECDPDYLALDIKSVPSRYNSLLGARLPDIYPRLIRSIQKVKSMGENAEVRITLAPKIIDTQVMEELAMILNGVSRVFLQRMNQSIPMLDTSFNNIKPFSADQIETFREILAPAVRRCIVR